MTKTKAIALCRVSTVQQKIHGNSLQAQETRVYECANYLSTEIIKIWSLDTSSRKGKNRNRPDLMEMLEFIKKHKSVKYVIVDEADRFMRSIDEAYYWKTTFSMYGATLAYANMPEITHEENPMAVMREMMAFFQAEASNHERITKTTDKMKARIQAGYYPGMVHQGYKKSDVKGIHVPREPQWSLLQSAMRKILYEAYNLDDALEWLKNQGYTLQGGGPLDMWKLKRILLQPYYAGVIKMSDWDVECKSGLHKPMITYDEHERLAAIAGGRGKKFTTKKYNPDFRVSNIVECAECLEDGNKTAKLVGYRGHNNKPLRTRRFYDRYRCRGCGQNILKSKLHDGIDEVFDKTELALDSDGMFLASLKQAWKSEVANIYETIARQRQKISLLTSEKDGLVRTLATSPDLAEDIRSAIQTIKQQIDTCQSELEVLTHVEDDFDDFVDFALEYANNIKEHWWDIEDAHDRIRFKQLVYLDGLRVSRAGKVLTPTLSPIYRYKTAKKTPESVISASKIATGGPGGA